jgi:hypothetical protein
VSAICTECGTDSTSAVVDCRHEPKPRTKTYHAVTITLVCQDKDTLENEVSQFYAGLAMQPWDHTVHSLSYEEHTLDLDPEDVGDYDEDDDD